MFYSAWVNASRLYIFYARGRFLIVSSHFLTKVTFDSKKVKVLYSFSTLTLKPNRFEKWYTRCLFNSIRVLEKFLFTMDITSSLYNSLPISGNSSCRRERIYILSKSVRWVQLSIYSHIDTISDMFPSPNLYCKIL